MKIIFCIFENVYFFKSLNEIYSDRGYLKLSLGEGKYR